MSHTTRRVGYVFLCGVPFLDLVVVGFREFRVPGVYQAVGGVLFGAIAVTAWTLVGSGRENQARIAMAGALLIAPWAFVSLFWVGLGPPWEATAPENVMRYLILLAGSIAVFGGFVVLKEVLADAGERVFSTAGFAANLLAGSAYLVWLTLQIGGWSAEVRDGHAPAAFNSLGDVFDVLLDAACLLTYVATALFAASLGRTGWLGRGAARGYAVVNLVAAAFLVARGVSFPDPASLSTAWYTQPSFIAGIPAVPWIMPFLLGVVLLRRAGLTAQSLLES